MAQDPTPKPTAAQLISFYMAGGQELMGQFSKPDKPAQFKFRTTSGVQDLTLVPGQPTPTFTREPESTVMIYQEQAATLLGQPPVVVPLAETQVDLNEPRILVLLNLDETSEKITLQPINQGLKALPPASVNFYNQTRTPLKVKIGANEAMIEPLKQAVLPIGLKGQEAEMVRIQVSVEVEGKMQLASSGAYALSPQDRRIILLAPGKTSRIRMTLLDSVPAEAEEPAGTN